MCKAFHSNQAKLTLEENHIIIKRATQNKNPKKNNEQMYASTVKK